MPLAVLAAVAVGAAAIVVAFISGWASIYFLLRYLRTHTTHIFIYYRYALGLIMAVLLVGGYIE